MLIWIVIQDIKRKDGNCSRDLEREKKAFAQSLNGGKRSRRTPWGSLARKNAQIPGVVKVNNYRKDFCLLEAVLLENSSQLFSLGCHVFYLL
jgi:hypothetical protein